MLRNRHSGNQASPEHPESLRLHHVVRRFWTRRVPDGNPSSQNDDSA